MLIRMRLLRACQVFLFAGLLLVAGQAVLAQSAGATPAPAPAAAPSQTPQAASPQTPQAVQPAQTPGETSAKPQTPAKFEDAVRLIQKEGRSTTISNNIAEDLGLVTFSEYMLPVQAHALDDVESHRVIYVLDDTRTVLLMIKTGDIPVVYLADRAGVLRKAGRIQTGRLGSQSFQRIPMNEAGTGFNAEKEFWIKASMSPDPQKARGAMAPAAAAAGAAPAGRTANQATATSEAGPAIDKHSGAELTVSSTPDGAEIEIDRKVAGNTPMTVPLSHGEHWVTLRKDGYQLWRRRIRIEGSPLEVNAELLPQKEKAHWF